VPIVGAHMLLYTPEAEALRATLRDVFEWDHVEGHDPADGWLIFALPPSELGVHPAEAPSHELTLMCRDIESTIEELRSKGVEVRDEPQERDFGIVTTVVLPGGVDVLLYEPKHNTPLDV
jgi:hypothetical protein